MVGQKILFSKCLLRDKKRQKIKPSCANRLGYWGSIILDIDIILLYHPLCLASQFLLVVGAGDNVGRVIVDRVLGGGGRGGEAW